MSSPISPELQDTTPANAGSDGSRRGRRSGDAGPRPPSWRTLLPSLVLNALLPWVAYQLLTPLGVPPVQALVATAIFPLVGTLAGWWRTRRLDAIGAISLATIAGGVVTSLLSDDPLYFQIKESLVTGAWSLACFGSLVLMPRPLMFYLGRAFVGAGDAERAASFDRLWEYPSFRFAQRLITAVWGAGYALEAVLRVVLALALPISQFLAVSSPIMLAVTAALVAWTFAYSGRVARRARGHHRADDSVRQ